MEKVIKILKEAKEGTGAYSHDQHTHACNVIDNMKDLIGQAIKELEKDSPTN